MLHCKVYSIDSYIIQMTNVDKLVQRPNAKKEKILHSHSRCLIISEPKDNPRISLTDTDRKCIDKSRLP